MADEAADRSLGMTFQYSTIVPDHSEAIAQLDPGTRIGAYEIMGQIGQGGMGIVYKARHHLLGRIAALKFVRSRDGKDLHADRQFQSEAQSLSRLDHPGIVPVFEFDFDQGRWFMAMAYVEGETLWERVKKSPLEEREAARVLQQVAEAVHHAHEQGIIHRDLKPQNILLDRESRARVVDFGLSDGISDEIGKEPSGTISGTLGYMSPEQAKGQAGTVGKLSDIFSLGATLYAALTGVPPITGSTTQEKLANARQCRVTRLRVRLPNVSLDLNAVCMRCLSADSSERYSSAAELASDLERFQLGLPVLARKLSEHDWMQKFGSKEGFGDFKEIGVGRLSTVFKATQFKFNRMVALKIVLGDGFDRLFEPTPQIASSAASAGGTERESGNTEGGAGPQPDDNAAIWETEGRIGLETDGDTEVITEEEMNQDDFRPADVQPVKLQELEFHYQLAGRLCHPGIAAVHDIIKFDDRLVMVMEYIDGPSLYLLRDQLKNDFRRIAQIIQQVARTIQYVHDQGVIHRDIKPANILLNSSSIAKVTDFETALLLHDNSGRRQTGRCGTPCYMSPEQTQFDPKLTTFRTDVYNLGATLYDLTTGNSPVRLRDESGDRDVMDILKAIVEEEIIPPRQWNPELPPELEAICLKCLQKIPENRYESAAALADDLERFLANQPIPVQQRPAMHQARRWFQWLFPSK